MWLSKIYLSKIRLSNFIKYKLDKNYIAIPVDIIINSQVDLSSYNIHKHISLIINKLTSQQIN